VDENQIDVLDMEGDAQTTAHHSPSFPNRTPLPHDHDIARIDDGCTNSADSCCTIDIPPGDTSAGRDRRLIATSAR